MRKKHRMRERWFRVVEKKLPECVHGLCHYEDRLIEVQPDLEDKERLETLIHEAMHACHRDMTEDAVDQTASSITNLLWNDGWRKRG